METVLIKNKEFTPSRLHTNTFRNAEEISVDQRKDEKFVVYEDGTSLGVLYPVSAAVTATDDEYNNDDDNQFQFSPTN